MKKTFSMILALALLCAWIPALGESAQEAASYSGQVAYRSTYSITAPFGGTMQDFTVQAGSSVSAGEPLFSLSTTKVYAPCDGTVRGLRAQPGDDAATVINRYQALAYIEPAGRYTVSANTAKAYKSSSNGNANRYLCEGETVYLTADEDDDRTGSGVITSVDGRNFTVEVTQSTLYIEDTVSIYRDAACSSSQRLAKNAKVQRAAFLGITGEGSVLRSLVKEGDQVKRGDLLFELVKGALDGLNGADSQVASPVSGVIAEIKQTAGSPISKGDVLATVFTMDDLCVTFDVDESDLNKTQEGGSVKLVFDALGDQAVQSGTIRSILSVSSGDGAGAKYTVYVDLASTDNLREGMSVTIYLQ